MRTTAIINLKGGVAKTTTALNMAAILAKDYKQRVLLVDADSQCNCTEFFQRGNAHPGTLADMLRGLAPCIEHSRFAEECGGRRLPPRRRGADVRRCGHGIRFSIGA